MSEATLVDGKTGSQWLQLNRPGWYDNPDDPNDPFLDMNGVASLVGCHPSTVSNLEAAGELKAEHKPVGRSRWGTPRKKSVFHFKAIAPICARWQQDNGDGTYSTPDGLRLNFKVVENRTGCAYGWLLKQAKKVSVESKRPCLFKLWSIAPKKVRPARAGTDEWTILEREEGHLKQQIELAIGRGVPEGYETATGIAKHLGLAKGGECIVLLHALHAWHEIGLLQAAIVLREEPAGGFGKGSIRRLRPRMVFDSNRAYQLWTDECNVAAGAKLVKRMLDNKEGAGVVRELLDKERNSLKLDALAKYTTPRLQQMLDQRWVLLRVLKEAMRLAGFVGPRFDQACREAKVVRRRLPNDAEGNDRNKAGCQWVCLYHRHDRLSAETALRKILSVGHTPVQDVRKELVNLGWSFRSPEVKKAWNRLRVRVESVGSRPRHYYCLLPGQTLPLNSIPTPTAGGRGRPLEPSAAYRRRVCWELYTKPVKKSIAMIEAKKLLVDNAPKEWSHLRKDAMRHAKKFGLPCIRPNFEENPVK
jgi:hypothetical protein